MLSALLCTSQCHQGNPPPTDSFETLCLQKAAALLGRTSSIAKAVIKHLHNGGKQLPPGLTIAIIEKRVAEVKEYNKAHKKASIAAAMLGTSPSFPSLPVLVRDIITGGECRVNLKCDLEVHHFRWLAIRCKYGFKVFDDLVRHHIESHPLPEGMVRPTYCMEIAAFNAELRVIDEYGMDAINALVPNPDNSLSLADQLIAFKQIVAESAFYFFRAVKDPGIQAIVRGDPSDGQFIPIYTRIQKHLRAHDGVEVQIIQTALPNARVIPKEVTLINGLTVLHLQNSALQFLPTNFGKMAYLLSLDLRGTKVSFLPRTFCDLGTLQWLFMSNTPINELPPLIGDLGCLRFIDLLDTGIEGLPASFASLLRLDASSVHIDPLVSRTNLPPHLVGLV